MTHSDQPPYITSRASTAFRWPGPFRWRLRWLFGSWVFFVAGPAWPWLIWMVSQWIPLKFGVNQWTIHQCSHEFPPKKWRFNWVKQEENEWTWYLICRKWRWHWWPFGSKSFIPLIAEQQYVGLHLALFKFHPAGSRQNLTPTQITQRMPWWNQWGMVRQEFYGIQHDPANIRGIGDLVGINKTNYVNRFMRFHDGFLVIHPRIGWSYGQMIYSKMDWRPSSTALLPNMGTAWYIQLLTVAHMQLLCLWLGLVNWRLVCPTIVRVFERVFASLAGCLDFAFWKDWFLSWHDQMQAKESVQHRRTKQNHATGS